MSCRSWRFRSDELDRCGDGRASHVKGDFLDSAPPARPRAEGHEKVCGKEVMYLLESDGGQ